METRTDPHSPTNLITEDYEYIFTEANHIPEMPGWVLRRGDFGLEMSRWIARTDRLGRSTNQCHHCGAHLNYFAVLKHLPTGDAVVVGETCLENRFERATADFQALRKAAKLGREAAQVRQARKDFLTYLPEELGWLDNDEPHELIAWNDFVCDIQAKFHKYGQLSERQVSAVLRIYQDAARKASEPEEEEPNWEPAPLGRHKITGTVLTAKFQSHDFGTDLKLLLQVDTDEGAYKVWMNCPKVWRCGDTHPQKGDTVTVKVTLERGRQPDADPAFVFGKRATAIEANMAAAPCGDVQAHDFGTVCACHTATDGAA